MKTKYIVVSMGLALASSSFVANADWDSSSADATVTADVLNQLTVLAPEAGENDGALGKILTNETRDAQLGFRVQATEGYQLQFNASVTECKEMGENGLVELTTVSVPLVPEYDSFTYLVYYTYHAPQAAKLDAECMVNLAATYM